MADAVDTRLFGRELRAPRYTSYPTALQFDATVDSAAYCDAVARSNDDPLPAPLSVYVHLPFCARGCFYCGCNKVVSRSTERHQRYVEALLTEIRMQAQLYAPDRELRQLHFGGGTPNLIARDQLSSIVGTLRREFRCAADMEFSLEVDPRLVADGDVAFWATLGVNRISIGVQDVDGEVQRLINRVQPATCVAALTREARHVGISSINYDLIYGLPGQTPTSFARTLEFVQQQRPERVAVFHYAHMPERFAGQRAIDSTRLPDIDARAALQALAHNTLTEAGYVAIGLDHYALPEDTLARAYLDGHLHRNFQGYSTQEGCDVVGLGASSISHVGPLYAQNEADPERYRDRIDAAGLAHVRGYAQSTDDRIREQLIQDIMCRTSVRFDDYPLPQGQRFERYFAADLARLAELDPTGSLARRTGTGLGITALGRRHLRLIAQCFDIYNRVDGSPANTPVAVPLSAARDRARQATG